MLEANAENIIKFVEMQYDVIIMRALSKVPDMDDLHLYPLVPMSGVLRGMNLQAIARSVHKLTRFHPDIVVYFHTLQQVTTLPDDPVLDEAIMTIHQSMRVERHLYTRTPRGDGVAYMIEEEVRQSRTSRRKGRHDRETVV